MDRATRNWCVRMRGARGGTGRPDPPPPPEKSQNIGILGNTGPDPLKNHKPPSQHSMLGHHRHASETHLSADDGPLIVVFGSAAPINLKR